MASYVDGLDTVVELVAGFTPERAEAVSGLPAAEVRRLARELAAADSGVVYSRIGVSAGPWGTVCQWAVDLPQRAHRQPRPPRRRDVHDPGDRRGGHAG